MERVRNPDFPRKADSCSPAYDLLNSIEHQAEVSCEMTLPIFMLNNKKSKTQIEFESCK